MESTNRFISLAPRVYELAARNYVSFQEALEVYVRAGLKEFKNKKKYGLRYNQKIQNEAFNLAERYFAIERAKEIKELKKLEELEKIMNL